MIILNKQLHILIESARDEGRNILIFDKCFKTYRNENDFSVSVYFYDIKCVCLNLFY